MEILGLLSLAVVIGSSFTLGVLFGVRFGKKWTRHLFIRVLELEE